MVQTHVNKYPARYFLLTDPVYADAWREDNVQRRRMIEMTAKVARQLGAQGYRFLRTPQGGYAPGIFVFEKRPNEFVWKVADNADGYVPNEKTPMGQRLLDIIAEIPSCLFLKTLSVAGIDNIANIALPPNQVLEMEKRLYLVWYAPDDLPAPPGAQEITVGEFDQIYLQHVHKDMGITA